MSFKAPPSSPRLPTAPLPPLRMPLSTRGQASNAQSSIPSQLRSSEVYLSHSNAKGSMPSGHQRYETWVRSNHNTAPGSQVVDELAGLGTLKNLNGGRGYGESGTLWRA
ncbi:hypothetical protein SERLA73DRAFT_178189 [Serpula lacrymans var. lacrymans S7.3]|uniref:Uncharacterized protein n=2 Tax=Serpula lacrymans var. lacrymans TaxID=341189 RepID=F8PQW6_SERL3|nr:uncharacterized protein SERLADRAFT_462484 [Serpula lacrymans var. lacrymans S7.9]EGO02310.1 hypothetical protein SERLA73DRAFT_178189 [Serpula lacrymans var. lacrymans S7.3]EGO28048.1 hypothetical protein SERLADRAFT_462484 [Serpula lacrymans var. lacrymans S7.9]